MPVATLRKWEQEFRRRANGDKLAVFRDSLRALKLRAQPRLMLEGTIDMVRAAAAYEKMDGRSYARFLGMQIYDPAQSATAVYALLLDINRRTYARLLVGEDLNEVDLADLYGHIWDKHKARGYGRFWISRIDQTPLKARELARLERLVTKDFRFDYPADELDISFDRSQSEGALFAVVEDCEGVDIDLFRFFRAAKAIEVLQTL